MRSRINIVGQIRGKFNLKQRGCMNFGYLGKKPNITETVIENSNGSAKVVISKEAE